MEIQEVARLTWTAVKELGINVPIMKVRVIGEQVELSLYGGRVVRYPPESISPSPLPSPAGRGGNVGSDIAEYNDPAVRDLEGMEYSTIVDLAKRKGINTKEMSKRKLIRILRGMKP